MLKRLIISLLLLATSPLIYGQAFYLPIKAQQLAHLETLMWRAYYDKNFVNLGYQLYRLSAEEFHLSRLSTLKLSFHATRAALIMRRLPENTQPEVFEEKILEHLTYFYSILQKELGLDFNVKQVAQAELNWWVMRRFPERYSVRQVGKQITSLYELLTNCKHSNLDRAGYMRAQAAMWRYQQAKSGKTDWKSIEKQLLLSYQLLANLPWQHCSSIEKNPSHNS